MFRGRTLLGVAMAVSLPLAGEPRDVFAFVQANCAACHNASLKSGDIDLVSLQSPKTFEEDREIWAKVAGKLKLGQMPPAGLPRPPAETIAAVTRWIDSEFSRQDRAIRPEPGRVSARRLNRAEYNNTIRDLLGVDIRPADNFPCRHRRLRIRQYQRRSASLARAAGEIPRRRGALGPDSLFGPPPMKPAVTHYPAPSASTIRADAPHFPRTCSITTKPD